MTLSRSLAQGITIGVPCKKGTGGNDNRGPSIAAEAIDEGPPNGPPNGPPKGLSPFPPFSVPTTPTPHHKPQYTSTYTHTNMESHTVHDRHVQPRPATPPGPEQPSSLGNAHAPPVRRTASYAESSSGTSSEMGLLVSKTADAGHSPYTGGWDCRYGRRDGHVGDGDWTRNALFHRDYRGDPVGRALFDREGYGDAQYKKDPGKDENSLRAASIYMQINSLSGNFSQTSSAESSQCNSRSNSKTFIRTSLHARAHSNVDMSEHTDTNLSMQDNPRPLSPIDTLVYARVVSVGGTPNPERIDTDVRSLKPHTRTHPRVGRCGSMPSAMDRRREGTNGSSSGTNLPVQWKGVDASGKGKGTKLQVDEFYTEIKNVHRDETKDYPPS
ncbi:hypothetical protein SARC_12267 [Sphaeroforma arctica JP610]|uniref:Uncharacterized protein n=1 Tax=Sphaeroforma arctica JP610 TaxID=667725 RepID=A0A0L0FGN7_9EUKA|nr:hypothetical protein SARC_12267 [Sphaeroforma arctica JP610]KNC75203.1 hypothetical protein SARC_12267 [Sphaeroforma arctica JP610]|eukprot:XP_014149105.1 hypothetical protein SARC_12267 [Sphaeroforma arctica JP610]